MRLFSFLKKLIRFCIERGKRPSKPHKIEEWQRKQDNTVDEIRDWAKFEGYYGNGRLF